MSEKQYDDTNRGVAFLNQRKLADKHPDFTGKGNYDGVEFEISIWRRKDRNGNTLLSLAFKAPYQKPERPRSTVADDIDDGGW